MNESFMTSGPPGFRATRLPGNPGASSVRPLRSAIDLLSRERSGAASPSRRIGAFPPTPAAD